MAVKVHKDNTMEDYWHQYQLKVYGHVLNPGEQAKQLKEVFYSAFYLGFCVLEELSCGYPEDVACKALEKLKTECVEFGEKTLHNIGS